MRIGDGPLSCRQGGEIFEGQLEHYLAGGELLPNCGGLSITEIDAVRHSASSPERQSKVGTHLTLTVRSGLYSTRTFPPGRK